MANIFFTSDLHISHKSILKYTKRPFSSIIQHDAQIIKNWNNLCNKSDTIYFLGDFCFGSRTKALEILKCLNGHICFIKGNHDASAYQVRHKFMWFKDVHMIKVYNQEIWLSHYAHLTWPKVHYGAWHLFGHSHGSLLQSKFDYYKSGCCLDVGIDSAAYYLNQHEYKPENYRPFSFYEIKEIMQAKQELAKINNYDTYVDHHRPE